MIISKLRLQRFSRVVELLMALSVIVLGSQKSFCGDGPTALIQVEVKLRQFQLTHPLICTPYCFMPGGQTLAIAGSEKFLIVADARSGLASWEILMPSRGAGAASKDGKLIATSEGRNKDDAIKIWDVVNRKLHKTLEGHATSGTNGLAFSPDGTRIHSCGGDGTVRCADVNTGKLIWKSKQLYLRGDIPLHFLHLALAHDGKRIAVSMDRDVKILDAENGELVKELRLVMDQPPYRFTFSYDGKLLIVSRNHLVEFVTIDTAVVVNAIPSGVWPDVSYSPDGKLLVIASREHTIIYDAATLRELKALNGAGPAVFSQDGKRLATSCRPPPNTSFMLWDLEALEVIPKKK